MASDPSKQSNPSTTGGDAPRDRRQTPRAALGIPGVLGVGTRQVGCSILDMSRQGIALVVKETVASGMVVRLNFRLPNSHRPVEVAGVLVRSNRGQDGTTVGLQLIEPDADALRVIDMFVARNRSDRPFSGVGDHGADESADASQSERDESLEGLYQEAVSGVSKNTEKRRGFFARWFRRDQ